MTPKRPLREGRPSGDKSTINSRRCARPTRFLLIDPHVVRRGASAISCAAARMSSQQVQNPEAHFRQVGARLVLSAIERAEATAHQRYVHQET